MRVQLVLPHRKSRFLRKMGTMRARSGLVQADILIELDKHHERWFVPGILAGTPRKVPIQARMGPDDADTDHEGVFVI